MKGCSAFPKAPVSLEPPTNECPGYETKQSDGEVPVRLGLSGIRNTPSMPLLPGSLWPGVVASGKGFIYGSSRTKPWFREFSVFAFKLRIYANYELMLN